MPAFVIMHAPALIFTNNEPGTRLPTKVQRQRRVSRLGDPSLCIGGKGGRVPPMTTRFLMAEARGVAEKCLRPMDPPSAISRNSDPCAEPHQPGRKGRQGGRRGPAVAGRARRRPAGRAGEGEDGSFAQHGGVVGAETSQRQRDLNVRDAPRRLRDAPLRKRRPAPGIGAIVTPK